MPESGTCTSIINLRYQDGRVGSPSNPEKFNHQDYAQLKDQHLRAGTLFVDDAFPPNTRSLGGQPDSGVEWLRPAELLKRQDNSSEPTFFPQGASRFDFGQGYVSNCWFLAAISSLTFNPRMIAQVVPMDQSFEGHAGIFHFRFWRFGKWVDVVIDDLLPTMNNFLVSVHCKGGNTFWVPLLEKAYAKVCGSYDDMNFGLPSEAFKDFSGGVYNTYELEEAHHEGHDEELWLTLCRATKCKSMICCGTRTGDMQMNSVADNGLVIGHSYSVTGVTEVDCSGSKVKLVRIMNPWGGQEWMGKWADRSDIWDLLNAEDQAKRSLHHDGEFWMELDDFYHNFLQVSVCFENPNFIDGDFDCQWKCMTYDGSWVAGKSAGGSIADTTFETNPQYRIQVSVIDEKEPGDKNILISLMQKPQMLNRLQERFYPAGLAIFKIPPGTPKGRLENTFFEANPPEKESSYYYEREVIELLSLEPGEYAIVPSTKIPYMTADFVLTVYIKAKAKTSPHDDQDDHEHDISTDPENPGKCIDEDADMGSTSDLFNRYVDQNGELLATQLQRLLNDNFPHGTPHGFGLSTCKSLIAMVDIDQRMTMTFTEFSVLWKKIHEYNQLFHRSNLNQTGTLSDIELQKALEAAGMDVSEFTLKQVMFRYTEPSSTSLKNFIVLMMRLENTSNVYQKKSQDSMIHLTWEETLSPTYFGFNSGQWEDVEWSNVSLYN